MRSFITGISGFFGLNAVLSWSERHEIWGTYLRHPIELPGNRALRRNLADVSELNRILNAIRPEVVIHAAAMADVDTCERDPPQAQLLAALTTSFPSDSTVQDAGLTAP